MSYKYLKGVLLLVGLGLGSEAHSLCTLSWLGLGFETQHVSMNVGKVSIKPSDKQGLIHTRTVNIPASPDSKIICGILTPDNIVAELIGNPQHLGDNVYATNIEGIGIRLKRTLYGSDIFSGYYPYTQQLERGKEYSLGAGEFVIEIFKTAPTTGTGALQPGLYSKYYLDTTIGRSNPILTTSVVGETFVITASSCEIEGGADKTVTLPTASKKDFNNIGSTYGATQFNIKVTCVGGKNALDTISLSFDYQANNGTNNVLKNLASDDVKARGIGTQLVSKYPGESENKPIANQGAVRLGQVGSEQTVTYELPLEARYYQTEATVTAGEVKSMTTVTIQYD